MSRENDAPSAMAIEESRRLRLDLIQRFAEEVATWPSAKLRAGYAQPETVRRAEAREAGLRAETSVRPARESRRPDPR